MIPSDWLGLGLLGSVLLGCVTLSCFSGCRFERRGLVLGRCLVESPKLLNQRAIGRLADGVSARFLSRSPQHHHSHQVGTGQRSEFYQKLLDFCTPGHSLGFSRPDSQKRWPRESSVPGEYTLVRCEESCKLSLSLAAWAEFLEPPAANTTPANTTPANTTPANTTGQSAERTSANSTRGNSTRGNSTRANVAVGCFHRRGPQKSNSIGSHHGIIKFGRSVHEPFVDLSSVQFSTVRPSRVSQEDLTGCWRLAAVEGEDSQDGLFQDRLFRPKLCRHVVPVGLPTQRPSDA